jgi:hypothetical protein
MPTEPIGRVNRGEAIVADIDHFWSLSLFRQVCPQGHTIFAGKRVMRTVVTEPMPRRSN